MPSRLGEQCLEKVSLPQDTYSQWFTNSQITQAFLLAVWKVDDHAHFFAFFSLILQFGEYNFSCVILTKLPRSEISPSLRWIRFRKHQSNKVKTVGDSTEFHKH